MQVLTTLKRPIVTEKTTLLQERNKYVFEVMPYATKGRVRAAVERAFNVRVTAVNILKTRGEQRRIGRNRRLVRVCGHEEGGGDCARKGTPSRFSRGPSICP